MRVSLSLMEFTWPSTITAVSLKGFGIIKRDKRISMSPTVNYMPHSV